MITSVSAYVNVHYFLHFGRFTFDPRDVLIPLHIGFNFVRAVAACAVFHYESLHVSETTAPRYSKKLKLFTTSALLPLSPSEVSALFIISSVFNYDPKF